MKVARNLKLTNLAANTEADALGALLNNGWIKFYTGTQPATADTALSGQTLLAEPRFGSPAFAPASSGIILANAITADPDAAATGTATWFRMYKSDGTTAVLDGSIGTSGCDINMPTVDIVQHAVVPITSLSYTVTK